MNSTMSVFLGAFFGSFIYELMVEGGEVDIYRVLFLSFFVTLFYSFFRKTAG